MALAKLRLLLSFIERALPRAASAVILLATATVLLPEDVGSYSILVLVILAWQAILDNPARQCAVVYVGNSRGRRSVYRLRLLSGPLGVAAVVVSGLVMYATGTPLVVLTALCPLVLVPVFQTLQVAHIAVLQRADRWRSIAKAQALSVISSLLVSLPLLWFTSSLLAPAGQMFISELVFFTLLRRLADKVELEEERFERNFASEFRSLSLFTTTGWLQLQGDRIGIALLAGPAQLAVYSLGWSLGRSPGDAVTNAAINVLRPELARVLSAQEWSRSFARLGNRALWRAGGGSLAMAGIVVALLQTVVVAILDESWRAAIDLSSLFAILALPALGEAVLVTMIVVGGRARHLVWARILGIVLVIPVVIVAVEFGLLWGALALFVRQLVTWSVNITLNRDLFPRVPSIAIALVSVLSVTTLLLYFWSAGRI